MRSPIRTAATLTLVAASPLAAQTTLAGRVVDRSNHAPVAAVTVELLTATDSVLQSSATTSDGAFALSAPRGGTYRVRMFDRGIVHVSDSVAIAAGEYNAREFPLDLSRRPFAENEVDKPTVPARGSSQPRYPAELKKKNIGGCALAEFVIDSTGQAEPATLRFVVFTHREFAQAVIDALPRMRFEPAEFRGRKVRQFVSQPFGFSTDPYHEWECLPAEKKERQALGAGAGGWVTNGSIQHHPAPRRHLELTGRFGWFWYSSGLWTEGRRWLEEALALPESREPDAHRARARSARASSRRSRAMVPLPGRGSRRAPPSRGRLVTRALPPTRTATSESR